MPTLSTTEKQLSQNQRKVKLQRRFRVGVMSLAEVKVGCSPKAPETLLGFLKASWSCVADRQQRRKCAPVHLHFRRCFEDPVSWIFLDIVRSCCIRLFTPTNLAGREVQRGRGHSVLKAVLMLPTDGSLSQLLPPWKTSHY